ncbi:hypothetical protein [Aquimarina rhabdastrellae]
MAKVFTTLNELGAEYSSIYYLDTARKLLLRFKYAKGKVYVEDNPNVLFFEGVEERSKKQPSTKTHYYRKSSTNGDYVAYSKAKTSSTPKKGAKVIEVDHNDYVVHPGHKVDQVDISLNNFETPVIETYKSKGGNGIITMKDLKSGKSSLSKITRENQKGDPIKRSDIVKN